MGWRCLIADAGLSSPWAQPQRRRQVAGSGAGRPVLGGAGARRRCGALLAGAVLTALGPAVAAFAEVPSPSPSGSAAPGNPNLGPATAGTEVCAISTTVLDEITGMVATDKGIYAVEGGDTLDPTSMVVWTIDATTCKATSKNYGFNPIDPQDMAVGSDGSLWIADIGDSVGSENTRPRIALEKVEPGTTKTAVPYRALYPDSGKFHAEAMLLDKDDVPIIISHENGKGVLYTPTKPLVPDIETGLPKLAKVGEFTPAKTGTDNPLGVAGQAKVTGAAKSPDDSKVVIRTASDAYEFTVGEDGDIAKAITDGTPLITPLPNEPNGKAITYRTDDASLLTLSATDKPKLLSYTPFVPTPAGDRDDSGNLPQALSTDQSWLQKLSYSELTRIVAAAAILGLVLTITWISGIRRARRRRRKQDEYDRDYDEHEYDEPASRGRRGRHRTHDAHGFADLRHPHYPAGDDPRYSQYGWGDADAGHHPPQSEAAYGQQNPEQIDNGGYGGQPYGGDYGGPGYGHDGGQQYQGQHYDGQQYDGQGYRDYGAGYRYEDDLDPLRDPRRR